MFTGKRVRFLAGVEKAVGNQSLSLAGKTGVVRKVTPGGIVVTMDRSEPSLDEWGNEVVWTFGEILYSPKHPELVEPWECLKKDRPDSEQLSCLRFFMLGYLASLCEILSIEDEWEEKAGYLDTVGTRCDGGADWSVSTWHLGPGVPNRTSGGYYILDCEDGEDTFALVRRFFDEDTGDDDEIITISESKTPWGLFEIYKAIRRNRRH